MKYSSSGFRKYYTNTPIILANGEELRCNVSCLYTDLALFVIVEPRISLQGPKLTRFRHSVLAHVVALLRVPPSKQHRMVYIERYTHVPNEQWLQINIAASMPTSTSLAPTALRQELQFSLLDQKLAS